MILQLVHDFTAVRIDCLYVEVRLECDLAFFISERKALTATDGYNNISSSSHSLNRVMSVIIIQEK